MEKCWGTPVADRENSMRYYMIQDGCPVRGDTSLNIRSNGQSLQGKFDIKMFKFIGDDLNDVWLHCTVRACEATTNEACLPDCGEDGLRKKRSEKKKLNFISAGRSFANSDKRHPSHFKLFFEVRQIVSIILLPLGFEPRRTVVHWNLSPKP